MLTSFFVALSFIRRVSGGKSPSVPWHGQGNIIEAIAYSIWYSPDSDKVRQSKTFSVDSWDNHPLLNLGQNLSKYHSDEELLETAFHHVRNNVTVVRDHMTAKGTSLSCGPLQAAIYNLDDILSQRVDLIERIRSNPHAVDTSDWFTNAAAYSKLILTGEDDPTRGDHTVRTACLLYELTFASDPPAEFSQLHDALLDWLQLVYEAPFSYVMFKWNVKSKQEAFKQRVKRTHEQLVIAVNAIARTLEPKVGKEPTASRLTTEEKGVDTMYWYHAMSSILR